jgi:hypothetical protein
MERQKRDSYGLKVRDWVKSLFAALLSYANGEELWQEHNDLKIIMSKPTETEIRVRDATLKSLTDLVQKYKGEMLSKEQIRAALTHYLKDFLKILVDDRGTKTKGVKYWNFTLKLWSPIKADNLKEFDRSWDSYREKSGLQALAPACPVIPSQFQGLIADKTEEFVGREYVFHAITDFLNNQPNGYFTIEADPGVGKSAILAEYVRRIGCVAYFNVRSQGINRAEQFLESVCTQLIKRYNLNYPALPLNTTRDGAFLSQLLDEVSGKLGEGEQLVIAIDALDEVDLASLGSGANILYLPVTLPKNVYFVLTWRPATLLLNVQAPQQLFDLMTYHDESLQDIQIYIRRGTEREQLRQWIDNRGLMVEEFVTQLAIKSENNFMYLYYVLGDLERGVYQDLSIKSLPKGLEGYYEDHWRRMGMATKPLPRAKIKMIYVLVEIGHPVSRQLISECAGEDQITVQEMLDEWEQFLHEQEIDQQTCYSVYHASFVDFLHCKDIVQAAEVKIKDINAVIADELWEGLYLHSARKRRV